MRSLYKLVSLVIILFIFAPLAAYSADVINIDSRSGSSADSETAVSYAMMGTFTPSTGSVRGISPTAPSPVPMPYPIQDSSECSAWNYGNNPTRFGGDIK